VLCLYSDSVIDATNAADELFSGLGLLGTANSYDGHSAQGLIKTIQDGLAKFTIGTEREDDIAMLALQYLGGQ